MIDAKRAVDLVAAALGLVVTAPVVAAAATAIWWEDRHSPIFRQQRAGADGVPFTIYKLRTMPVDTAQVQSSEAGALTITRTGAVVRRLNIDELPQLVNIVAGQMSVVGPRPALPSQTTLLELRRANGAAALKPGLTGLAQVNAYDGMPEDVKAEWDGRYAAAHTLRDDLTILLRTIGYLRRPPPAY